MSLLFVCLCRYRSYVSFSFENQTKTSSSKLAFVSVEDSAIQVSDSARGAQSNKIEIFGCNSHLQQWLPTRINASFPWRMAGKMSRRYEHNKKKRIQDPGKKRWWILWQYRFYVNPVDSSRWSEIFTFEFQILVQICTNEHGDVWRRLCIGRSTALVFSFNFSLYSYAYRLSTNWRKCWMEEWPGANLQRTNTLESTRE